MVNKNYNSGRQFEYRVKKYLEKLGYYVIRSAGSKSAFDLVAIPTNDNITLVPEVVFVQCKHGAKVSKQERDEIKKIENNFGCDTSCVVAWSKKGGAIEFFAWIKTLMIFGDDKYEWGEALWIP